MKQISGFVHMKWTSLLLSVLLTLPIALFSATVWFQLLERIYSLKDLTFTAFIIFVLFFWMTWFLINNFLNWLKTKQINVSRRDYILLFVALLPMIAAVYYGWKGFEGNQFPNTFISKFEVEITSPSNISGNICILEIKDQNGVKVRPDSNIDYDFLLTGDWTLQNEGCQYFSQGKVPGSLKFYPIGMSGELFQVLFRGNEESGKALVHVNGEQIAELDLNNEQEGNKPIPVQLQLNHAELLFWNMLGTAGWSAVLVVILMGFTLLLKNIHIPSQVSILFDTFPRFMKKHPWASFVPIAIGIAIMFWPTGSYQSSDVAYYLSLAKNLYHGNGYVNPDLSLNIYRGPVFPLLISLSYLFFGEVFRSAILMERIFWALTILITYILGRQLFNYRVGFLASLFVLSASVVNITFNFVWTDGPVTFFTLVLQLMFWNVFKKPYDDKWYVLMGLLMGTTYLLKQSVIFVLPLPLLVWAIFSEYRTRRIFKQLIISYSIFALFYFGWDGYVYLAGGSSRQATGTLTTIKTLFSYISRLVSFTNSAQISSIQTETAKTSSISIFEILSQYYIIHIRSFFNIAIIFPVALTFTLYQAIVNKMKADIFLLLGLVLYLPLIVLQVTVNFGFRQNLYFYCIVIILTAAMLDRIFGKVLSETFSNVLVLTVAASLVLIQVSGGRYAVRAPVEVINRETLNYFPGYQTIALWVDEHVKPEELILISSRDSNYLHILTTGNRQFETLNTCTGDISFSAAKYCKPPYISFWIYKGTPDPENPRDFLQGISETSLISTINEKNVKYLFVTQAVYSLYFYLRVHPDFEEVTILDNIAVFRVIQPARSISNYADIKWETCVGIGTPEYLKNLEKTDPARYETRLREEIEPWMGLSKQDLDIFKNWRGCKFEVLFPGTYHLP